MTDPAATSEWVKVDGLAEWFGFSQQTMRRKLPKLYGLGFPPPNPVVQKWYLPACKKWASERFATPTPATDALMMAIEHGRKD